MAPVYATEGPFALISTPISQLPDGQKPDIFDECASEMAWVHNIMVRGLNSIYLQAEHITQSDEKAFCQYILHWYKLIHVHHTGEETTLFPHIEELAGEDGIMGTNVDQHHAFHGEVHAFIEYVEACLAGTEEYDGKKVMQLIDAFGTTLTEHLADEIPTLLSLRKYGDKVKTLPELLQAEAEKNMKLLGLFNGMPWAMGNVDVDFEGGIWRDFPPAPWLIKFAVKNITYWAHADWWKFCASDRNGHLQPLYATA